MRGEVSPADRRRARAPAQATVDTRLRLVAAGELRTVALQSVAEASVRAEEIAGTLAQIDVVEALLAGKADGITLSGALDSLSAVQAAVAGKADAAALSTAQSTLTALQTALVSKAAVADVAAIQSAVAGKASAAELASAQATLAGVTTALTGKASVADVTALAAQMPVPSDETPRPEATGGAAGLEGRKVSGSRHQHPRLTSTTGRLNASDTSHTIAATGKSPPIMFTRSFASEPGLDVMPIMPNAADILLPPYVDSWVMGTGAEANVFKGVVIGWKKLVLQNGLAAVNVAGISVVAGANIANAIQLKVEAATGVRFSCIAVARSDMAAT